MLRDYEPADWITDQFSLAADSQGNPIVQNAELCFPCFCCIHGTQDQREDPCHRCGHNEESAASQRTPLPA